MFYSKKSLKLLLSTFPLFFFITLASFPVFPVKLRSIFIIFCVLSCTYLLFKSPVKLKGYKKSEILYLSLPVLLFILYSISYLYSTNKDIALFALEKRLSLIAFPFIAWAGSKLAIGRNFRVGVLFVFVLASLILIIKTLIIFEPQQFFSLSAGSVKAVTALRKTIATATNLHPTYLSIYLLFSCLILIEYLLSLFKKQKPYFFLEVVLSLLLIGLFLTAGFITAARTPLISFIITLFVRLLISQASPALRTGLVLLLVGAVVMATISIPTLNNRVQEVFKTSFKPPESIYFNSTNLRVGIFDCTLKTIHQNWMIGTGVGDSQKVLNECLERFDTPAYKQFNYNTHNQYLGIWLDVGILGFCILLGILLSGLYIGYSNNDPLQVSFFIFMAFNMLTENILATQAGIVFFMYFYTFFLIQKKTT